MGRRVWAEVTSLEHGHGGAGWGLGLCLWSPGRSKDNARRYGVMTLPRPGDAVVHLVSGVDAARPRERYLFGTSLVASPAVEIGTAPPIPGNWAGAVSYYRIDLDRFVELPSKPAMTEIEEGLTEIILADLVARPKYYPYAPYRNGFRGAQGIYLTLLTQRLADALSEFVELGMTGDATDVVAVRGKGAEYAEGERLHLETSYFRRNPALRAAAIQIHGPRCAACSFDFEVVYGAAGAGYIEIHHLDPLAERVATAGQSSSQTSVNDVVPLCANCHRVVHRRRPALSLAELKAALVALDRDLTGAL